MKGYKFYSVVSTALTIISYGFMLTSLVTVVLTMATATHRYSRCKREHVAATLYYESFCQDGNEIDRLDLFKSCEKRSEVRKLDPALCMCYSLLDEIGLCGSEGCVQTWKVAASRLMWSFVGTIAAALVVIYVLSHLQCRVQCIADRSKQLPYSTGH